MQIQLSSYSGVDLFKFEETNLLDHTYVYLNCNTYINFQEGAPPSAL